MNTLVKIVFKIFWPFIKEIFLKSDEAKKAIKNPTFLIKLLVVLPLLVTIIFYIFREGGVILYQVGAEYRLLSVEYMELSTQYRELHNLITDLNIRNNQQLLEIDVLSNSVRSLESTVISYMESITTLNDQLDFCLQRNEELMILLNEDNQHP